MIAQEMPPSEEALRNDPTFELVVARHAEYYDPKSEVAMREQGVPEDEIQAKVGHLTEVGKEQARDFGLRVLDSVLRQGEDTDITLIASTQLYESPAYPEASWSGRRAEETADQAMASMMGAIQDLESKGLIRPGQVRLVTPRPTEGFVGEEAKPNNRLVERDVYNPDNQLGTSMVSAYRERTEKVLADEERAGERMTGGYNVPSESAAVAFDNKDKREKELWSRGEQDIDQLAGTMGAETSENVADRVMGVVDDINGLAQLHAERNPGRKLAVVLLSHDAVVGAITSKGFGAETPVIPGHMDAIDVRVENGVAQFEQDGKMYERTLA